MSELKTFCVGGGDVLHPQFSGGPFVLKDDALKEIESLQSQLAEETKLHERLLSEALDDRDQYLEKTVRLERERDKLQYVVGEMRNRISLIAVNTNSETTLEECRETLELNVNSLPPLYTEEEVRPLVESVAKLRKLLTGNPDAKIMTSGTGASMEIGGAMEAVDSALSTFQRKDHHETRS